MNSLDFHIYVRWRDVCSSSRDVDELVQTNGFLSSYPIKPTLHPTKFIIINIVFFKKHILGRLLTANDAITETPQKNKNQSFVHVWFTPPWWNGIASSIKARAAAGDVVVGYCYFRVDGLRSRPPGAAFNYGFEGFNLTIRDQQELRQIDRHILSCKALGRSRG